MSKDNSRIKLSVNDGWRFHLGDIQGGQAFEVDDSDWRSVDLPHDWQIEQSFDADMAGGGAQGFRPRAHIGWYRLQFSVPPEWEGSVVRVVFDGIQRNGVCFINGHILGGRPYGYVEQDYDLSAMLKYGQDNILAVCVDNTQSGHDRWYSGAGIYRNVWMIVTHPVRIASHGVRITTQEIGKDQAVVHVSVKALAGNAQNCTALVEILSPAGQVSAAADGTVVTNHLGEGVVSLFLNVPAPCLWEVEDPSLYTARIALLCDGMRTDGEEFIFGIRSAVFDGEKGFLLNGKSIKLKGVNIHHDGGCVGAAVPVKVWQRRLETLKAMGCNAIRTCHNPPAPEFLDLCDLMGFLVIDEALDKWRWEPGYYHKLFDVWSKKDLLSMIDRDFNHPCVIVWSVGNEIEDQGSDRMMEALGMLCDAARQADPTRPASCALNTYCVPPYGEDASLEAKISRTLEMAAKMDVLMANYHELWYEDYRTAGLHKAIIGSEIFSYFRSRGPRFESMRVQPPWLDVAQHDWVAGGFIWAGIDYFGESIGYPAKGWAACLLDTAGFRKPRSWLMEAFWKNSPVLRLSVMDARDRWDIEPVYWSFPRMVRHWNFEDRGSEMLTVAAMSNCDSVRLYLNDNFYGEERPCDFPDRIVKWPVPFRKGEIRAEGLRDGIVVIEDRIRTAGEPAAVVAIADCPMLTADGHDIAHIIVSLTDADGTPVMTATPEIFFNVEGPIKLLGVDNGDMLSDADSKGNRRSIFRGHCLAIVQAGRAPGDATVTVKTEGMQDVCVSFRLVDHFVDRCANIRPRIRPSCISIYKPQVEH